MMQDVSYGTELGLLSGCCCSCLPAFAAVCCRTGTLLW